MTDSRALLEPEPAISGLGLPLPLVIDLDEALLRTDLSWECVAAALRHKPMLLLALASSLFGRRDVLQRRLSEHVLPAIDALPMDDELVDYARMAAEEGRPIVLLTTADPFLARRIAARLPFACRILPAVRTSRTDRAAMLARLFPHGFDYAGRRRADLAVWRAARRTILVRPQPRTVETARSVRDPLVMMPPRESRLATLARALRLKQWAKNTLVFAPVLMAGRSLDPSAWSQAALAFVALGLVASATYLLNDLVDLADDRRHWSKRTRPLASGALAIPTGLLMVPALLTAGLGLALAAGLDVAGVVVAYLALTLAYSAGLKKVPILDVSVLAGLFTLRLFLGVVAIGAAISPWLFVFSMALFLSLSVAKRHTEVVRMAAHGMSGASGRGYVARDEALLLAIGVASAASAIVLLTLYLTGEASNVGVYSAPSLLWIAPVTLMLWLGRVWLLSQRGELDDDPVAFALRDGPSLALGAVLSASFAGAAFGGLILPV